MILNTTSSDGRVKTSITSPRAPLRPLEARAPPRQVPAQRTEELRLGVPVVADGRVQLVAALARQDRGEKGHQRARARRLDVEVAPREAEDDRRLVLLAEHRVGGDPLGRMPQRDDERAAPPPAGEPPHEVGRVPAKERLADDLPGVGPPAERTRDLGLEGPRDVVHVALVIRPARAHRHRALGGAEVLDGGAERRRAAPDGEHGARRRQRPVGHRQRAGDGGDLGGPRLVQVRVHEVQLGDEAERRHRAPHQRVEERLGDLDVAALGDLGRVAVAHQPPERPIAAARAQVASRVGEPRVDPAIPEREAPRGVGLPARPVARGEACSRAPRRPAPVAVPGVVSGGERAGGGVGRWRRGRTCGGGSG
jgi:hypothetical protein